MVRNHHLETEKVNRLRFSLTLILNNGNLTLSNYLNYDLITNYEILTYFKFENNYKQFLLTFQFDFT